MYLMREKSEASKFLMSFYQLVKTQLGKLVKRIRTDNGLEFDGPMRTFYEEHGMVHETSCVERKHRHILEVARALRFQASLPIKFWGECVLTVVYLINRTPTVQLHKKITV